MTTTMDATTSSSTGTGGRATITGKLAWVRLQTMQVFWPAYVYESYSHGTEHSHDMTALRTQKPVLDAEDRVVYFFGVGSWACLVRSTSGPAPTLQLCVAHEDDIRMLPLGMHDSPMVDEFATICRSYHVVEENIMRAEKNSCFQRACEEALRFKMTVHSDEEAAAFFLALMVNAKKTMRGDRSSSAQSECVSVNAQKSSLAASPSRTAHSEEPPSSSSSARQPFFSPPQSKLSKALNSSPSPSKKVLPGLELIAPKCWKSMLDDGWESMTQADGQVLYKMPGISFMNFRPNENIFDSLVKACNKYLVDWAQASREDESEQSELMQLLWPMVEASGWVKISSANETWYMMPNTAFNQCVPNVTIFRSKAQVVSKYLAAAGLIGIEGGSSPNQATDSAAASTATSEGASVDNQEVDDEMDVDESEEDEDEASDSGSSEEENEARSDENEVEEVAVVRTKAPSKRAPSKKPASKTAQRKSTKATAVKPASVVTRTEQPSPVPAKKLTFGSKPKVFVPPFKCTFGKIESELRDRGWYWKPSSADWKYFKPSCRLRDVSSLKANVDFFDGRTMLEDYLDECGLYDEIRSKLRREHEQRYNPSSDSEDDDDVAPPKKKQAAKPISASAASRSAANDENSKENRSNNVMQRSRTKTQPRAAPASLSSSRRGQTMMSADVSKVKFGEIWAALSKKGWHLKQGKFEYDYFKPHCQDANEGVPDVDYFPSKSMLVSYLESSGIWEKTAREITSKDAIDVTSSDDEEVEPETAAKLVAKRQALFKRKSNSGDEQTPTSKPSSKKMKVAGTFSTPTEQKRSAADAVEDGDESDTADKISPEAGGPKASALEKPAGSHLSRKLADCFTPSPGNAKKGKSNSPAASHDGPLELFADAIQKLTLGYSPPSFQYRDEESRRIVDFFQTCFAEGHGSSMYISGAPGCGKSALLKSSEARITKLYQEANGTQDTKLLVRSHVNAIALNDSSKLYCQLAEALTNQAHEDGASAFEAIERATNTKHKRSKTMILILDEIDTLLKKNGVESDLCRLFELAHRPSHSFILVGIANQVDFTERHLPLLQQQLPDCKPQVVIFKPYVHQTIELILIDRLGGKENALKMLNAHGISFLSRKIASTTGDIRMALDICRRVLQHRLDAASDDGDNGAALLMTPVPLTDMLRLVKASLESKSSQVIQSLPRNLQMILFASTRLVSSFPTDSSATSSTGTLFGVDELYACYRDVSQEAGVFKPLAFREFKNALNTLGSEGLLGAAELKKQLVKLLYTPSELLQSFRNDAYFARLV